MWWTDGQTDGRTDRQGVSIFFNVENSIKREIRKNCFSKKKIQPPPPPPPRNNYLYVGNSMKREENMKYFLKKILNFFFNFNKFHKKFKQHSINIKNYTAHPHDMVHVPAKFRENTSMRFWVTVQKLNVTDRRTDRQTDGGRCNISRPGPSAPREIIREVTCNGTLTHIRQKIIYYNKMYCSIHINS